MMRFKNRERLNAKLRMLRIVTRQEVRRSLERGAEQILGDAADAIQEQTPSGVFVRSKGNPNEMHEVSPGGSAPNADTGELHTSLTQTTQETARNIVVEAGANTPYAVRQELGDENQEPRPYMAPAFRGRVERIRRAVRNSSRRAANRMRGAGY